ncbi:condensation domain-containing protein [Streptomyces nogalater]
MHHIAGDAESMGPLADDLSAAYRARLFGESPQWTPLTVQYADYAVWQRHVLGDLGDPASPAAHSSPTGGPSSRASPRNWNCPPTGPGPPGPPAPARRSPRHSRRPPPPPRRPGRGRGRHRLHGAPHGPRHPADPARSGHRPAHRRAGRGRDDEALDGLVGFFLNTLVLRTDTSGDPSFRELLARVRRTDLDAYEHQAVPFERLVEALNPARSPARHPCSR